MNQLESSIIDQSSIFQNKIESLSVLNEDENEEDEDEEDESI
jgi:hypothetical protein